jgi:sigma-B regulation protein RsbU (phosphoserine phosphatase)
MLRSLAEACCSPGEVLTKLNHLMAYDFPAGKFVTMVYAVLDPEARTVVFSNAGHLLPLYLDGDGARFFDVERGLPLGVGCGDYSETQIVLTEGSRLIFYSDGITEAVNPDDEEFGLDRLATLAAEPAASAMSIAEGVRTFANGAGVRDDASVVFVGVGKARVPQRV